MWNMTCKRHLNLIFKHNNTGFEDSNRFNSNIDYLESELSCLFKANKKKNRSEYS